MIYHIVALSGGKDSTAMALRLRELHPERHYEFVCTPTGDELAPMLDHWRILDQRLGVTFLDAPSLPGLIYELKALPNPRMRWCTRKIKIEPFRGYVLAHRPAIIYVGIRADEDTERGGVYGDIEGVDERHPMREWGWTINEVVAYLTTKDIEIPWRSDCARCPYQGIAEWWLLWKFHPDDYARAEASEAFVSQARGQQHTLRSNSRDSWPSDLRSLRHRFEGGDVPLHPNTGIDLHPFVEPDLFHPVDGFDPLPTVDAAQTRSRMCRACTL